MLLFRADCGRCRAACFPAFVPFGVRAPGAAEAFGFVVLACGLLALSVVVDAVGTDPGAAGLRSGGLASAVPGHCAAAFFDARRPADAASCRSLFRAFAPT